MVLNFFNLQHDRSLSPHAWYYATSNRVRYLVDKAVNRFYGGESKAELFGASVANLATFASDIDINVTIPFVTPTRRLRKIQEAQIARLVGRIEGMKNTKMIHARITVIHATYHVSTSFIIFNSLFVILT